MPQPPPLLWISFPSDSTRITDPCSFLVPHVRAEKSTWADQRNAPPGNRGFSFAKGVVAIRQAQGNAETYRQAVQRFSSGIGLQDWQTKPPSDAGSLPVLVGGPQN